MFSELGNSLGFKIGVEVDVIRLSLLATVVVIRAIGLVSHYFHDFPPLVYVKREVLEEVKLYPG